MSGPLRFSWSDAWLFLVFGAHDEDRPLDLAAILGHADAINHAIATPRELNGAVNRLRAAGLLDMEPGRLVLTPSGRAIYREAIDQRGSALTTIDRLGRQLNRLGSTGPVESTVWFDENEVHAAYEAYLRRLRAGPPRRRADQRDEPNRAR